MTNGSSGSDATNGGGAEERYELGERVGLGVMGAVYRAKERETGRSVALKFLHEQHSADPGFVARFREEARSAARIQHPNVVQVLDYGRWDDKYFIAMEFVEGVSLREYLKEKGQLSVNEAIELMLQTAAAVEAAHQQGVVHGDLKPENVLVRDDGTIRVVDFGLARAVAPGAVTRSAAALATAQYIAPEVVQGKSPSPASDVYALGVVFYELLTGKPPFSAYNAISVAMQHMNQKPEPPSQVRSDIPQSVEAVILKALAKRPEQRYATASELRDALHAAQKAAVSPVTRIAQQAGLAAPYSRLRLTAPLVGVVLGTIALGLALGALVLVAIGGFGGGGGAQSPAAAEATGTAMSSATVGAGGVAPTSTPQDSATPTPTGTRAPTATATARPANTNTPAPPAATSAPPTATTAPPAATATPAPPTPVPPTPVP